MTSSSPCFGIDLGTTCSSIGLVTDGIPRLLPLTGSDYLPSVVWFPREGEPVVGHPAVNQLPLEPDRTIRSVKRWMGTDHKFDLGDRVLTPVEVSAAILRAVAAGAEAACGLRPQRVVVTVPAWFTQAQRGDTRLATEAAGLELVRMINEPTAAALAHAHGHDLRRKALVYDLGGGTFDVSLVDQDGPVTEVRASRGDTRLGGDDVDVALSDLVLGRLSQEDPSLREAIDQSPAALVRLRLAVEQTKRALSETLSATLRVPFLAKVDGLDRHLEMALDRADLDSVLGPLLDRTVQCVEDVLKDAGVEPKDIDELLLVGGSTRLPQVWETLRSTFGLEGSHAIPPRKAVALGAAIQAAIVDGSRVDGILVDVAPWPLSVGHLEPGWFGQGGDRILCKVVTPRNAALPSRHSTRMSTVQPDQDQVLLPLFQGADPDPRKNAILAEVRMDDLPPAPAGSMTRPIGVEIRHDLDGMVELTITDELSGRQSRVRTAADGEAKAELWASFVEQMHSTGLLIGDEDEDVDEDEDIDEGEALEQATPGGHERPSVSVSQGPLPASADSREARSTFEAVLAQATRLEASHPKEVEELKALAYEGLAALSRGDEPGALSSYDTLSDRLFSLGVYL